MKNERLRTRQNHLRGGAYLKDAVYAANDGIITTFAVIAGVVGASLPPVTVVLLGIAYLLADGFSMATSNYLGTKSEHAYVRRERKIEEWEVKNIPEEEIAEVSAILRKKGYTDPEAEQFARLIAKKPEFWVDFMVQEELGLPKNGLVSPLRGSLTTFIAFVAAGILPVAPYLFLWRQEAAFSLAALATGCALFLVGSLRSSFTGRRWPVAGFEMLFVGGFAAVIAYGVGALARQVLG